MRLEATIPGAMTGKITYQNLCQALAPRVFATSSSSAATPLKPASTTSAIKGVSFHT